MYMFDKSKLATVNPIFHGNMTLFQTLWSNPTGSALKCVQSWLWSWLAMQSLCTLQLLCRYRLV